MNEERPIEKLLRRFAKKRRDDAGAPLTLHAATRRLLQGEVARQYPKTRPAGGSWFVRQFLPRFALAMPVLIVLGLGTWMYVNYSTHKSKQLAYSDATAAAPAAAAFSPPAESPAPVLAAGRIASESLAFTNATTLPTLAGVERDSAGSDYAEATSALKSESAKMWAVNSAQPATPTGGAYRPGSEPLKDAGLRTNGMPDATVMARADEARKESAIAGYYSTNGAVALDKKMPASPVFASTTAPAAEPQSAQQYNARYANRSQVKKFAVLGNFSVEQTGQAMRVIDGDGSTYTGTVQLVSMETLARKADAGEKGAQTLLVKNKLKTAALEPSTDSAEPVVQNYYFRVSGTNRTLQQPVEFVGNCVAVTNAIFGGVADGAADSEAKRAADISRPNVSQQSQQFNYNTINGRARWGKNQEAVIDAVQVSP